MIDDGADRACTCTELCQAPNDVGLTIAGGTPPHWVGEAMARIDYHDLSRECSGDQQHLADTAAAFQ